MPNKIKVIDKRTSATPKSNLNQHIDEDKVDRTVWAALKHGVDPKIALAILAQESNFGKSDTSNPFRIWNSSTDGGHEFDLIAEPKELIRLESYYRRGQQDKLDSLQEQMNEKYKSALDDPYEYAVLAMKRKFDAHPSTDPAMQIQSWNGLGVLGGKGSYTKSGDTLYGEKLPIDTRKNPVYGKRILDIVDGVINQSPDIQDSIQKNIDDFNFSKQTQDQFNSK
jgi:hypothetical protein